MYCEALTLPLPLTQVRTPYMLVQQHDYVMERPFDVRTCVRGRVRAPLRRAQPANSKPNPNLNPNPSPSPSPSPSPHPGPNQVRNLLRTMASNAAIKHVRLNTRGNIQRGFDGVIQNYTGHSHVPLRPSNPSLGAALTLHWSR